jgi:high-affinity nickel-transport protein
MSLSFPGRPLFPDHQFTAGMTMVDSLDSILMLYAYASPSRLSPEGRLAFFQDRKGELQPTAREEEEGAASAELLPDLPIEGVSATLAHAQDELQEEQDKSLQAHGPAKTAALDPEPLRNPDPAPDAKTRRMLESKTNAISSLSITLTVLSILVAFR